MTTVKNAAALRQLVSTWVDRNFNFISLQNAEKVFDNLLYEYIEPSQSNKTANIYLLDHNHILAYMESEYKSPLAFVLDNHEEEYLESIDQFNYPVWSTLFEFKEEPGRNVIEAAKEAGFGVVSESEYYNTLLYSSGCGYSFFGAHWIPLYLSLPWIDEKSFSEIDYSGQ